MNKKLKRNHAEFILKMSCSYFFIRSGYKSPRYSDEEDEENYRNRNKRDNSSS